MTVTMKENYRMWRELLKKINKIIMQLFKYAKRGKTRGKKICRNKRLGW